MEGIIAELSCSQTFSVPDQVVHNLKDIIETVAGSSFRPETDNMSSPSAAASEGPLS